jgi:hypothetical protein
MKKRYRLKRPRYNRSLIELADGEFQRRKDAGITQPGTVRIEKMFGLRKGQLASYRANHYSRKAR